MASLSKNDPAQRRQNSTVKFAISSDCESCLEKCERGKQYLERLKRKGCGTGVPCGKK